MSTNNNNTATTATLRNEINVTLGCDWGEKTDDVKAYTAFVQRHLKRAYHGTDVTVSFDSNVGRRDLVTVRAIGFSSIDVRSDLGVCWNALEYAGWCGMI